MRPGLVMACVLLVAARPALGIEIREGMHEGRPQFVVQTGTVTWYYDRAGGGFSRLLDRDGVDWIAFSKTPLSEFPASAAAGYRGMPNAVFTGPDKGVGHPGFDQCESELAGPDKIRTRSLSGKWEFSWTFKESSATFVMEKADQESPWWFLFEGPVAGRFAPRDQYWGTSEGGPIREAPGIGNQRFGQWQWAYFGDTAVDRILFVVQHDRDELDDTFWYMGSSDGGVATAPDGMVVFGFGRTAGTRALLQGAGTRVTTGFLEWGVRSRAQHEETGRTFERLIQGSTD
jgi:hypothetical protein